jgi:hypothetical protein
MKFAVSVLLCSVALTVLSVVVVEGTMNEQLKSPTALVVHVVWATSLNFIVTVLVPPNPVPVTVTEVPTGPLAGLRAIAGTASVNVVVAVFVPSVAVTVYVPVIPSKA